MKKYIKYDFILCYVILVLMALSSFYNLISQASSFDRIRNLSNYLDMWAYTFLIESKFFIIICPVIIIYIGCKSFYSLYHSENNKNKLEKSNLNKNILKVWYKGSYFYALYSSIILIICTIVFNNKGYSAYYLTSFGNINMILLYLIIIITSIVFSITVVNIGLIASKYIKDFYLSVSASYLFILTFSTLSEVCIGQLFKQLFNIPPQTFNMYNMVLLNGNTIITMTYGLILMLVSTVVVRYIYKRNA